jgi:hypothetical protein
MNELHTSIIKRLGSPNTTIYFDIIKKEKQLHVSARGHRQVGSFGFARKKCFLQRPNIESTQQGCPDQTHTSGYSCQTESRVVHTAYCSCNGGTGK